MRLAFAMAFCLFSFAATAGALEKFEITEEQRAYWAFQPVQRPAGDIDAIIDAALNPKGFTYWLAGGGVKAGTSYGETDPLGHEAAVNKHHVRDLHATILHLMGLDHETLTYHYGGLDQRLTGVVPAEVIRGVLS